MSIAVAASLQGIQQTRQLHGLDATSLQKIQELLSNGRPFHFVKRFEGIKRFGKDERQDYHKDLSSVGSLNQTAGLLRHLGGVSSEKPNQNIRIHQLVL